VREAGFRPLIGPVALTAAGFTVHALAPLTAASLGLSSGGAGALALRDLTGIWAWLALAWSCARLFDLLLRRAAVFSRRPAPYPRLLADLVRAALFAAAGVAILLFVFEGSATGLIATSSVAIAVVGFALRNIISDVFSGIALGIDHPYGIGDWIEMAEGSAGKVVEISWRTTRLVSRDGVAVVMPNGLIAGHRLINYGAGEEAYRTSLRVALDPALPPERAKRILLAGALDAGRCIPGLAPDVVLQEYADGAAVYAVRFMVPDYGREAACRDAVGSTVLRALHHAGLRIARAGLEVLLTRTGQGAAPRQGEKLLRHIDLFRPFDAAELAELARQMEERFFAKGAVVVRRGEAGQSLYVLVEGALEVGIGGEGDDANADLLVPGDVFGEMSLMTGQPRSANVVAATDVVVYEIRKAVLDPVLRRRPEVTEGLATIMANRHALNARLSRAPDRPQDPPFPTREDVLGRLRAFFQLGAHPGSERPSA
jgi:small-conductance mechanosensitive channel/CRP-like cAMP-binding protein